MKGTNRRPMLGTCAAHERAYFLSPVLDARVLQGQKGQLDKFTSCHHQRSTILVPDAEFYVVKSIDVFEKGASYGRGRAV